MLIVTTNELPGWRIERVCGEVFGLTARSRDFLGHFGAGLMSLFRGELLKSMTENLADYRQEAIDRLIRDAQDEGGNAVIGMRFDTSVLADTWTEICAYGTAVEAVPVSEGARYTAAQLGYTVASRSVP
ncbi:YbjQ family protein [Mycobacterium asiaticum]|uniref:UPF0145 protein A5635_13855 n=1 Tax=Mycobacterium asiaticum TaxID=1790 RepID=A0A1A3NXW1_MYCAS|nr:YbjQ family protein [Mycobacterium asiaticum]OBK26240.1 hypothetical protein A5635_13855 [Mycobacterium asiaticum]